MKHYFRITREQRLALKRKFDQGPLYNNKGQANSGNPPLCPRCGQPDLSAKPRTYRQFRQTVEPTFGMDGAVVVPWCGMWLCIETDGYTHS